MQPIAFSERARAAKPLRFAACKLRAVRELPRVFVVHGVTGQVR
jgi:hypothetical protein